jgi:protein-S-isoprenylcysteine O-methyltransferase Ste14
MLKWIDIPPIWLVGFAATAWWQVRLFPMGLSFGGVWADWMGGVLILAGVLLFVLALVEFRRHRTTPVPHMQASNLINSGIFRLTRNPIYLGDALILTGLILVWDAVISLTLIPIFMSVIRMRFIEAE